MAKTSSLLKVIVVVVGLGLGILGGIWLVQRSPGPIQAGVNDQPTPEGDRPTNPTVEALKAELERVTQEELTTGCVEWDPRLEQRILCGESQARVDAVHQRLIEEIRKLEQREPEAMAAAIANIRALAEDSSLEVTFNGTSVNPYTTAHRRMEDYRDSRGMEYFVDPTTNAVFQFGPGPNSQVPYHASPRLSLDELGQKAEAFLTEHVPNFAQIKETFVYQEHSKGGRAFVFRWEAPTKPAGEEMVPFVQVVLSPRGEVMSFNNTPILYSDTDR